MTAPDTDVDLVTIEARRLEHTKAMLAEAVKNLDYDTLVTLRNSATSHATEMRKLYGTNLASLAGTFPGLLDAEEAARRAERALLRGIQAGREAGVIYPRGYTRHRPGRPNNQGIVPKNVTDLGITRSMNKNGQAELARLDDVTFEEAIKKGREAGDLRRTSLIRAAEGLSKLVLPEIDAPRVTRERVAVIQAMAARGVNSDQIGETLGVQGNWVRRLARRYAVDIPGDLRYHNRRIDPDRVIEQTVYTLQGMVNGLEVLHPEDYAGINIELAREAISAVSSSMRELRKLTRELRNRVSS